VTLTHYDIGKRSVVALAAHPIHIEAPIPASRWSHRGSQQESLLVGMRSMLESEEYRKSKFMLPLALGRDVAGEAVFAPLDKMPHLLIAGQTGSGKSVTIHDIILSMLYKYGPELLRFIMVDPKRVELPLYDGIPHLLKPAINENKKVPPVLKQLVMEMDQRYARLSEAKMRDVVGYNEWATKKDTPIMPYIVVVIDEMADCETYGRKSNLRSCGWLRRVRSPFLQPNGPVSVLTGLIGQCQCTHRSPRGKPAQLPHHHRHQRRRIATGQRRHAIHRLRYRAGATVAGPVRCDP
jgi:hypothetical protein